MAYRFICYGKNIENLNTSVVHELIGSKSASFCEQIKSGDRLFLYVNSSIYALAEAIGPGFKTTEEVWKDKLYPYRFKIKILKVNPHPVNFLNTKFKSDLYGIFGKGWGYKFLYSPKEIPPEIGTEMEDKLFKSTTNSELKLQKESLTYV